MARFFNEIISDYVDIPDEPRIVSLAPSNTDILYQIGAWSYVQGVSVYCEYPEEAKTKPRVGSYIDVIYSRLNELSPNLILTTTGVQRKLALELKDKGFNVLPVPLPTSLYGVLENTVLVASLLNLVENAYKVVDESIEILDKIKRKLSATVYFEAELGEPITIGSTSYITSALHHIGLRNIFLNDRRAYFKPDFEDVFNLNPEIIIYELGHGRKAEYGKVVEMLKKRGWDNVNALRNNRVYVLPANSLTHYGPLLIRNMMKLCEEIKKC